MTETTGHFTERDGTAVVRFERTFPHPVGTVWQAVTERAELEQWFPTTVEVASWEPGAPIIFRFAQDAYPAMRGEVLAVDPERALAFTWGEDTLTFALEPAAADACRLTLTVLMPELGKAARDSAGWESCLDMLAETVAGTPPRRAAGTGDWEGYYEAYRRAGVPATAEIPTPRK